jgi:transcriptional regulator with XRE-family HTH domain
MSPDNMNEPQANKAEDRKMLADFLRIRRERLTPQQVGLPGYQRRRTPGLRREEVAQLASMSLTWYTWLEQARSISVSSSVLASLATALRLTDDERRYMFILAGKHNELDELPTTNTISTALQAIVDNQGYFPAYLMGRYWELLAWNRAACLLFGDLDALPTQERNLIWYTFLNPEARLRIVDWPERAQRLIAEFRVDCSAYLAEPEFVAFVDNLKRNSAEFAEWWGKQDVYGRVGGQREFNHPNAGRLVFEQTTFHLSGASGIKLVIHAPGDATDTWQKLTKMMASSEETTTNASK